MPLGVEHTHSSQAISPALANSIDRTIQSVSYPPPIAAKYQPFASSRRSEEALTFPFCAQLGFAASTGAAYQYQEIRDVSITESADLAITKTDGVNTVPSGGSTTYALTVTNNGPSSGDGAILTDPAVAELSVTV